MSVQFILNRLNDNGYEAYIVGGCVRDSIMGIQPHDWDICTSALPEQVIELFKDCKVIPTGIQHGTVSIVLDDTVYEITTYRIDGEYKDNRHPDSVKFVSNLEADLARRDFTINAMAYNEKEGLIDYFGGINDIKHQLIRCVGLPKKRFSEDALRIMRALRFATVLGFNIEGRTIFAMDMLADKLKNISIERINSEVSKMLSYQRKKSFKNDSYYNNQQALYLMMIKYLHIINYKITEVDYNEKFRKIFEYGNSLPLNLAITFDNPQIDETLKWLRYSNNIVLAAKEISDLGHYLVDNADDWQWDYSLYPTRKLLHKIQHSNYRDIISFAKTLCDDVKDNRQRRIFLSLNHLESEIAQCIGSDEVYSLKHLAINGSDLLSLGYKGRQIGKILNELLDLVMRDKILNKREPLLKAIIDYNLSEND